MRLTEGVNVKRHTCYIYVIQSWEHKLCDIKQDWIVFKSAPQHQPELQLYVMEPKIMTHMVF